MCGVFGFYLNRSLNEGDIEAGKRATKALEHRGPDNTGFWYDELAGVFLGHTRLSIIDTSTSSNQPMIVDNHVITFNGEVYNYKELRQELKSRPSTDGDTETLLRCWVENGENTLNKLDGMFAFAVFNKLDSSLILANDPFGEKPLYYVANEDGLYFSSEVSPLIKLLKLKVDLKEEDITSFLLFGFLPGDKTGFCGLKLAEPATLISYNSHHLKLSKYWKPSEGFVGTGKVKPLKETELDDISHCLLESLKVRLRSDVPLGLFLSAGVDSSLIASLVKRELKQEINCLTVSFPDIDVRDESNHAAAIARYLGLPHEIIEGGEDPTRENTQMIYDIVGEVNSNTTVGAVYLISKAARSKYKVALCGLGGDELFFGYNKYHDIYQANLLTTKMKRFVKNFIGKGKGLNLAELEGFKQFIAIKHIANYKLFKDNFDLDSMAKYFYDSHQESFLTARYFDLTQMMPHSYILGMERASMSVALELRTPFLNKKLYDLLMSYDARSFVHFGRKDIAKRILSRYLTQELLEFPKNGFRSSVRTLFKKKPSIPVDSSIINHFWENKEHKYFEVVASRMVVLDYFYNLEKL